MNEQTATGVPPIAEETVAQLARMVEFDIAPDRLATVTDRLRDLYRLAADLDGLDLTGVAPATVYDPTWTEAEGAVTA
jgi:Asp-tRNA(Asn)/Glu-tRNA(Gln) amidotransferase C subunit